jgi:hypothetical protein
MFPDHITAVFRDHPQVVSNFWTILATAAGCAALYGTIWRCFWRLNIGPSYYFDAQDFLKYEEGTGRELPVSAATGTFAPLLKHYIGVTQLLITLAAASITFGGNNSALRGIFVAKLILASSILFGVLFCAFVLYRYDEYAQDVRSYTRFWYCTVEAFGFATLISFFIGYGVWVVNLGG